MIISRRGLLAAGTGALVGSVAGCLDRTANPEEDAQFERATAYLNPGCDCCIAHVEYMANASATIDVVEYSNERLAELKTEHGIPADYWSCHTTELDVGYVIEGHVPMEVINQVLEEEPSAQVVSLPGMPSGSPGMSGSKEEEWVFYAISEDGTVTEFTTR